MEFSLNDGIEDGFAMSHLVDRDSAKLGSIRTYLTPTCSFARNSWLPCSLIAWCLITGCNGSSKRVPGFSFKLSQHENLHFASKAKETPRATTVTKSTEPVDNHDKPDVRLVSDEQLVGSESKEADAQPAESSGSEAGESATFPTSGISLAQLEAIALANNPTLVQAQAAVAAEQGIYRQAGLYPNPQMGYLNGSASVPGVKQSNGMFFSQEIVTAKKLTLAQQTAAAEIIRYQWDNESQRRRVLNDLRIRYYEVLGAQEAHAVADRMVKIAEKSVTMAQQTVQAGTFAQTELNNAKVQLETAKLSRDEAGERYRAAWEQLATIVGASPMSPVPITDELPKTIPELDLETCWGELLGNSPQLRSNESDLGHAWATYREACAQAIPNVTVQTVGEYDRVTQSTTVSTLVALPVPIFNRNQGNIDKSSADICAAEAEIRRVQLVLRDQLADSYRRYRTSQKQAERLRDVILPSAEENMKLTTQLFEAQEIGLTPVLTVQHTYFQSQLAYVEALTEVHKVITEIRGLQLTGGLNPAAIGSAIQNQPGGGSQRQRALLNEVQDKATKQLLPAAQISQ